VARWNHEPNGAGRDRRSPWAVRIGPASAHQIPVPPQQRLGLDEEPALPGPGRQAAQPGKKGPIGRSEHRASDLPAKDRDLVTEDDDLNSEIGGVTAL